MLAGTGDQAFLSGVRGLRSCPPRVLSRSPPSRPWPPPPAIPAAESSQARASDDPQESAPRADLPDRRRGVPGAPDGSRVLWSQITGVWRREEGPSGERWGGPATSPRPKGRGSTSRMGTCGKGRLLAASWSRSDDSPTRGHQQVAFPLGFDPPCGASSLGGDPGGLALRSPRFPLSEAASRRPFPWVRILRVEPRPLGRGDPGSFAAGLWPPSGTGAHDFSPGHATAKTSGHLGPEHTTAVQGTPARTSADVRGHLRGRGLDQIAARSRLARPSQDDSTESRPRRRGPRSPWRTHS
jgi:hypothetical protein